MIVNFDLLTQTVLDALRARKVNCHGLHHHEPWIPWQSRAARVSEGDWLRYQILRFIDLLPS